MENFDNGMIRVLHSDYDPLILKRSKTFLEKKGMHVNTFLSIREALRELAMEKYHIFVCDYYMLEVNGIDIAKEFKRRKINIPFAVFSGKNCDDQTIHQRLGELEIQINTILKKGG